MQVIVIGPTSAPRFFNVVSSLHALVAQADITQCTTLCETRTASPADLVLILQSWPNEFSRAQMLALIDLHPLARLIVAYGPWCDSDGRTRDIWPNAMRVSIAEAPDRLGREIDDITRCRQPLPLTASREETYEHRLSEQRRSTPSAFRVCVISTDAAIRDWLRDVLEDAGHTVHDSIDTSCDLIAWDADPWATTGRERLAKFLPRCVGNPLIALTGFLRHHEVRELLSAGITRVLPKVINNDSLIDQLVAACGKTLSPAHTSVANIQVHSAR